MPTSPLYDSTRAALALRLPDVIDSQCQTLALIIVGISQSVSAQLGKIARALPLDTTQFAKQQRIRRLLDNQRITQADQYQPLAKAALAGLKGQRVQILIDRVLVQNWHNILVISVAFRPRSIPLVWKSLDHRGQSGLADQHDLLTQALALLMFRVRVSIHGDSEFRSQELFAWLRARGHDGMLGVTGRTLVATEAGSATQPLESWVRDRETVV